MPRSLTLMVRAPVCAVACLCVVSARGYDRKILREQNEKKNQSCRLMRSLAPEEGGCGVAQNAELTVWFDWGF